MLFTQEQHDVLFSNTTFKRHGFHRAIHLWPNGIVPVYISPQFGAGYVELIKSTMDYIMNVSCVSFQIHPDPPEEHHVVILKYSGCSSLVGRVEDMTNSESSQPLNIGDYCKWGNIVHELLHVLGLLHMHTALLRDDFVRINWKNIRKYAWKNFQRITAHVSMFDTQYDYRSIMHYTPKAFAINKNARTIIPFEKATEMGQRESK